MRHRRALGRRGLPVGDQVRPGRAGAGRGGFTVSGGEPMLQPDFTGEILGRCHDDLGLHTALDTSGFLGARASDAFLDSVDLVLLDIKSWDRELYMRLTSRQLEPTLVFARRLAALGKEVWVRFVLVRV
ncbi:radical SAM protein [Streptomyces sp. LN245]|uniref:radical SAM protein n=1 Tax=Streptomyces sp. LN245 TaxID=3112975 RepID=UPI00371C700F